MKQSEDSKAFFEKYGFTRTVSMPHPIHKDKMHFEGLEAEYVGGLEYQIAQLHKFIGQLQEKLDWIQTREFYDFKSKLKADVEKVMK